MSGMLIELLGKGRRGQSIVEVALSLPILALLLAGMMELGMLFYAYVQVVNASREGARAASRYIYDFDYTQAQNDQMRGWCTGFSYEWPNGVPNCVRNAVLDALRNLPTAASGDPASFDPGSYSTSGGTKDLRITYPVTNGANSTDSRVGDPVVVTVTYHYRLPFVVDILPMSARFDLKAVSQMRIVGR
jgi:hypothetical protein